jgi:hypothetical protein
MSNSAIPGGGEWGRTLESMRHLGEPISLQRARRSELEGRRRRGCCLRLRGFSPRSRQFLAAWRPVAGAASVDRQPRKEEERWHGMRQSLKDSTRSAGSS